MIFNDFRRCEDKFGRSQKRGFFIFEDGSQVECYCPNIPVGSDVVIGSKVLSGGALIPVVENVVSLPSGFDTIDQVRKDVEFFNEVLEFVSYEDYVFITANDDNACDNFKKDPLKYLLGHVREKDGKPYSTFPLVSRLFVPATFEERLEEYYYAAKHVLMQNEQEGNTLMELEEFGRRFLKLLKNTSIPYEGHLLFGHEFVECPVRLLIKDKDHFPGIFCDVINGKEYVAFEETRVLETNIRNAVKDGMLMTSPYSDVDVPALSDGFCDEQRAAVENVLHSNGRIAVITGGPGVGKTTVIRAIVKAVLDARSSSEEPFSVKLLAPTGKASSRIAEVMGDLLAKEDISTVHKFVGYGSTHFVSSEALYKAGLVIIDEASMLDVKIFGDLLGKMNLENTKVVLVGDVNQLPSVECGNLLFDLINMGTPVSFLNKNHRNSGNISTNAKKILNGDPFLDEGADFAIKDCSLSVGWLKVAVDAGLGDLNHNIVFSPYRKDGLPASTASINEFSQKSRISRDGHAVYMRGFSIGDRVVFTQNNYQCGYFNGECGVVTSVHRGSGSISVLRDGYDSEIEIDTFEDVELSYGLTIHKSQGSEYDSVEICLPKSSNFVTRRMLYTAVTRAKRKVTIYASKEAVRRAILNTNDVARLTFLSFEKAV